MRLAGRLRFRAAVRFRSPTAGLVLFLSGCTSSSSSITTTSPSAPKCEVSGTLSSASFPHSGGSGSVAITGARDCTWSMSSTASWVVPERSSGQGAATVPFKVLANATPASRRGNLSVESTQLELIQDGAPCSYDLDHTRIDVEANGGVTAIRVTAMAGCQWSAQAHQSWISMSTGGPVNGSGVIQLSIVANDGPAREGSATIAAYTVPVAQKAAASLPPTPPPVSSPPSPSPSPPPPPSPTPPTTPAPPTPSPGEPVKLEGRVSSLAGACPTLTFVVNGIAVDTNGSTTYRGGNCKHVDEGRVVGVTGRQQADGRVRAEQIDLKP